MIGTWSGMKSKACFEIHNFQVTFSSLLETSFCETDVANGFNFCK